MAGASEQARPAWWLPLDILPAATLLVLQVGGSLLAQHNHPGQAHLVGAEWLLVVAGPLALLGWRRYPIATPWITLLAALGPPASRFAYMSLIVAFFLTAVRGHRRAGWAVIVAGFVGSQWIAPLVWGDHEATLNSDLILGGWLAMLVVAAEAVRLQQARRIERRIADQIEARRRIGQERLRMARDLHDVIGHNISLINVQAAVGLDLMDGQPQQARAALEAIKTVSKDALGELRTMLATLREDEEDAPRAPAPGLDRLQELIDLTRAGGVPITLETSGPAGRIPAAVDVAAYRIVQEALTNVTRHAPGAAVRIRIDRTPETVVLEILDSGGRQGTTHAFVPGRGSGITGMYERATALGGRLDAGPRPGTGFRVRAELPVGAGR